MADIGSNVANQGLCMLEFGYYFCGLFGQWQYLTFQSNNLRTIKKKKTLNINPDCHLNNILLTYVGEVKREPASKLIGQMKRFRWYYQRKWYISLLRYAASLAKRTILHVKHEQQGF